MSRWLLAAICASVVAVTASSGEASPLLGTSVTGSFTVPPGSTNLFDPANGLVAGTCLNTAGVTVTIADPDVEFCASSTFVNFSDNTITLVDSNPTINGAAEAFNQTLVFTDAAFAGLSFVEISDTYNNGGFTLTQLGDQLTFTWAGTGGLIDTPYSFSAVYAVSAVPEPASLTLMGIGAAGLLARRRHARARTHGIG